MIGLFIQQPTPCPSLTWPLSNGFLLSFLRTLRPVAAKAPWMSMKTLASVPAPWMLLVRVTICNNTIEGVESNDIHGRIFTGLSVYPHCLSLP